jgi:L-fuculose-phosphate aldolase
MSEPALRRALVDYSVAMHVAGWVANHDGNLSARLGEGRYLATPTAMSKRDVRLDDLIIVDGVGRRLAGARRPFSEMGLHLAVYAARPDVQAVVHAHPPQSTAYGVAGQSIPHPFLPEAVVSLGAEIPLVPLTAPGAPAVEALRPVLRRCDAVLLGGNGVLAWGPTLELAFLRLELVEHLARIAVAAIPLGGVRALPAGLLADLIAKRRGAGLCAPEEATPSAAPTTQAQGVLGRVQAGLPGADPALVARLSAEVARALGRAG